MEVFPGQLLTPPTVSLLSSADIVPMDGDRWAMGFTLEQDGNGVLGVASVIDCEPDARDFESSGSFEEYNPCVLWASDKCSTFASTTRQFYDRAQRKLLANESTLLETQLWTGSCGNNPFLADGDGEENVTPVVPVPLSGWVGDDAVEALAVLERTMSSYEEVPNTSPSRGMIHVRPNVLYPLLQAQVIRRVGNVYLTPLDNIVVPGRGYPGTGPGGEAVGATEWMFGHPGIVQIRRGPVIRLGEGDFASQIDRSTNDRFVYVQRISHVALDTSVGVYAAEFKTINNLAS